jgi:hypothetical protein
MKQAASIGALVPLLLCGCAMEVGHGGPSQTEHVGQTKQALSGESCQLIWTAQEKWFCDALGQSECNGTCHDGSEPKYESYSYPGDGEEEGSVEGCECSCCDPPEPDPCPWWAFWCS